jgi:HTH-type transcriptional regulator/antitoxin HigA
MDIRPIRTKADYKAALKEISALMATDPDLGTPEGDRLDIVTTLVQAYEAKHVPIAALKGGSRKCTHRTYTKQRKEPDTTE